METPSAEPCTEAGAVAGAEGVVKPPRFECTIWDPQKQGIQNSQPFGFFYKSSQITIYGHYTVSEET